MKFLIAVTAALVCSSASAEFQTGASLLEMAQRKDETRYVAYGYLQGAHDLGRGALHCSPDTLRGSELAELVLSYLASKRDDANVMGASADTVVAAVLKANFPCPQRPQL